MFDIRDVTDRSLCLDAAILPDLVLARARRCHLRVCVRWRRLLTAIAARLHAWERELRFEAVVGRPPERTGARLSSSVRCQRSNGALVADRAGRSPLSGQA
jgi:hypothetical protein